MLVVRLRIGHNQNVVLQNPEVDRTSEMPPLIHKVHILIEDLDVVVRSVRSALSLCALVHAQFSKQVDRRSRNTLVVRITSAHRDHQRGLIPLVLEV
jgi:hypothetical protein